MVLVPVTGSLVITELFGLPSGPNMVFFVIPVPLSRVSSAVGFPFASNQRLCMDFPSVLVSTREPSGPRLTVLDRPSGKTVAVDVVPAKESFVTVVLKPSEPFALVVVTTCSSVVVEPSACVILTGSTSVVVIGYIRGGIGSGSLRTVRGSGLGSGRYILCG